MWYLAALVFTVVLVVKTVVVRELSVRRVYFVCFWANSLYSSMPKKSRRLLALLEKSKKGVQVRLDKLQLNLYVTELKPIIILNQLMLLVKCIYMFVIF